MSSEQHTDAPGWTARDSQAFIDYGRYFVPERETQIALMCDLIPPRDRPFHVIDLCCGEGLLSGAILAWFPSAIVHALDGSPDMLARARSNLVQYGDRCQTEQMTLADRAWRKPAYPVHAVVSSLAIHHLDGAGKQALFRDLHALLQPDGVLVIADVVQPATERGWAIAAQAWDEAVRERARQLDGDTRAFEMFERERWNMYRYFDPNDIDHPSRLVDQLQWLINAGFSDVDVYWMRAGHAIFGGRKP